MSAAEDRLEFVAEMTLMGFTPAKIAERLGVPPGDISLGLSCADMHSEIVLTVACVPTATKAGVAMGPWGVVISV